MRSHQKASRPDRVSRPVQLKGPPDFSTGVRGGSCPRDRCLPCLRAARRWVLLGCWLSAGFLDDRLIKCKAGGAGVSLVELSSRFSIDGLWGTRLCPSFGTGFAQPSRLGRDRSRALSRAIPRVAIPARIRSVGGFEALSWTVYAAIPAGDRGFSANMTVQVSANWYTVPSSTRRSENVSNSQPS